MLLRTLILACALSVSTAHGMCAARVRAESSGSVPGRFSFQLSTSKIADRSIAWQNHLGFLQVLNVVPDEIRLTVSLEFLNGGHYAEPGSFVGALGKVQKLSAGNLVLRLLAQWAQLLATDAGRPELAGEIFVALVNRPPIDVDDGPDIITIRGHNLPHFFQKIALEAYPVLADMVSCQESFPPETANDKILAVSFIGFNALSAMLSGQYTAATLTKLNLAGGLQSLGASFSEISPPEGADRRYSLEFEVAGITANTLSIAMDARPQGEGSFLIPALGNDIRTVGLTWASFVWLDEKELGGFLAVSPATSKKISGDLLLVERLLYPLLKRADAYQMLYAARELGGIDQPPLSQSTSHLVPETTKNLWRDRAILRERAIAYAMGATIELFTNLLDVRVNTLVHHIMERDVSATLSYADFEIISRRQKLPIWFVSNPLEPDARDHRAYPPVPHFAGRTAPPSAVLWINVGRPDVVAIWKAQIGMSESENLQRLRETTGQLYRGQ